MALCMSFLVACTNDTPPQTVANNSSETSVEDLEDVDGMKHEIVTVTAIDDAQIMASNSKGERYNITNDAQITFTVEVGQKIGISYVGRTENSDGSYELQGLKITKERPITLVPLEK